MLDAEIRSLETKPDALTPRMVPYPRERFGVGPDWAGTLHHRC